MHPSTRTGSAHTGLGEWLLQRLSALYLAGFTVFVVFRFALDPVRGFAAWKAWNAGGGTRIALTLFFASLLLHIWVGMRSVYMDYVRPAWLRFTLTTLTAAALLTLALWLVQILAGDAP